MLSEEKKRKIKEMVLDHLDGLVVGEFQRRIFYKPALL